MSKSCDCGLTRSPEFDTGLGDDCAAKCRRVKADRKAEKLRLSAVRKQQRATEKRERAAVSVDRHALAVAVASLSPASWRMFTEASERTSRRHRL